MTTRQTTHDPVELLLGKLRGVRQVGSDRWVGLCPNHPDSRPSLSVARGSDGRALVHCFAGCDVQRIVRSLGLEMSDLFASSSSRCNGRAAGARPVAGGRTFATAELAIRALERRHGPVDFRWDYFNAEGQHVGVVLRWNLLDGKTIRPIRRNPDNTWSVGAMAEPRSLYNLPRLLQADASEPVAVVEGEKSCDALTRVGIIAVTSSGGASAPQKSGWEPLTGRRVVLIPDCDKAGFGYVRDVAKFLARLDPKPEIRLLDLSRFVPDAPSGYDVADLLESDDLSPLGLGEAASLEDIQAAFRAWLDQAEPFDPDGPTEQVESIDRDGLSDQVESQHERSKILIYPKQSWRAAKTFVERFFTSPSGERLLVLWQGEFFIWSSDTGFWRRTSEEEIKRRIFEFLSRAELLIKKEPEEVCVNAPTTSSFCADICGAVRSLVVVPDSISPPCWFDPKAGDPRTEDLVAVKNGILNVVSEELLPHSPRLFCVNRSDVVYDPNAPQPERWLQFLDELWPNDQRSQALLQEFVGHLLTNDLSPQKFLAIIGPSGSGKGVIADILRKLLGEENVVFPTLTSFSTQFGMQSLIGRKVAIVPDARLGGDPVQTLERLLSISAGDTLSIPRKYLPDWIGKVSARLILVSNEMLSLPDAATALARRMLVLRTTRSFVGREDFDLSCRLEEELTGILNWAVEGVRRLRTNSKRFTMPSYTSEFIEQLREGSSPVGEFVACCCDVGGELEVPADTLYSAFRSWCSEAGRDRIPSAATFSRLIRAVVPELESRRETTGSRRRWFRGIRLKAGS